MQTHRELDENGYLTIRGNPISSFGIFDYSAGQLGLPGDPNRIVKVYRPESAVNDQTTMDSFKDMPFIVAHAMLSGFQDEDDKTLVAPEDKGVDGVLTGNVYYDAPWMRGDIKIFSRKAQAALNKGVVDLSLGYACKFYLRPGTWNGQDYEAVQEDLRGNHIALVPEGRVPGARVLDARVFDAQNATGGEVSTVITEIIPLGDSTMKGKRTRAMDNAAVQQLLGLIPALKEFLNEEATEPAHQEGAPGGESGQVAAAQPGTEGTGQAAASATGENEEDAAGAVAPDGEAGAATGTEGAATAGADLPALIAELESIIAKLKANAGAGQGQDEGEGNEEGQLGAEDAVEGLQSEAHNAEVESDGTAQDGEADPAVGKASPGPSAGVHAKAGDAALRAFYADSATKDRIYDRLSQVVGAFNCKAMDAREVAAYGVKKLNLKGVKPGNEIAAVDLYLEGLSKGKAENAAALAAATKAQDGKSGYKSPQKGTGDPHLDAFLKGSK